MFYRQKILLGFLEALGGNIASTDFEKLLFLFCQQSSTQFYDFIPYHYGCFSFVSYQDKRKLTEKEYLMNSKNFHLSSKKNFLTMLKKKDQLAIQIFARSPVSNLRGKELIRYVYSHYPYYAVKSRIASQILEPARYRDVDKAKQMDNSSTLFTVGYEGITIDAYLNKLIQNNVKVLVDVRKNPFSMKYGFTKVRMKKYLNTVGIKYLHLPDLGIDSKLRKSLQNKNDYVNLFDHYESNILPSQKESLSMIQNLLREYQRVALTCFEAEACMCHRHKITDYFDTSPDFNYPIMHL